MSTPEPDFNPFSAPAVAAAASPNQPNVQLEQYRTVRLGVQLIYYSIAATALLVILMVVIALVGISNPGIRGNMGGTGLSTFGVVGLMAFGVVGAMLTSLIGFCMCGACPNPNERTLALASIACFFLYVGSSVLARVLSGISLTQANALTAMSVQLLGGFAGIACLVTFCLLLKQIGRNISSQPMERNSQSAMTWFCVLIGGSFLVAIFVWTYAAASSNNTSRIDGLFGIFYLAFVVIVGLTTLFKYLAMLRTSIDELKPKTNANL